MGGEEVLLLLLKLEEEEAEEPTMAAVVEVVEVDEMAVVEEEELAVTLGSCLLSSLNKSGCVFVDKNFVKILKTPRVDFVVFSWFSSM